MATVVDICNIALSYLGDTGTVTSIDPPEGSPQADHCARFYPLALNKILMETAWAFATKRAKLNQLKEAPVGAAYAYGFPSDCLHIQRVFDASGRDLRSYHLERSDYGMTILTEIPADWIKYTTSSVPAELFPSDFADALAHLLAAKLAGAAITGSTGASMAEEQLKIYTLMVKDAMQRDALQDASIDLPRTPYTGDMRLPEEIGGWYAR